MVRRSSIISVIIYHGLLVGNIALSLTEYLMFRNVPRNLTSLYFNYDFHLSKSRKLILVKYCRGIIAKLNTRELNYE